MDPSSFLEAWRAATTDKAEYVAALPTWVRAWMAWMGVVLPSCLVFAPFRAEARWVLAALLASQVATHAIGMAFGWNRLWGLAHLLFWSPALALLLARWRGLSWEPQVRGRTLRLTPVLRTWAALTAGTMAISLAAIPGGRALAQLGEPRRGAPEAAEAQSARSEGGERRARSSGS